MGDRETRGATTWRILLDVMKLSKNKDAKTSVDAKGLVKAVLDFQFILGSHTLKVIFSNTNALVGKKVDALQTPHSIFHQQKAFRDSKATHRQLNHERKICAARNATLNVNNTANLKEIFGSTL